MENVEETKTQPLLDAQVDSQKPLEGDSGTEPKKLSDEEKIAKIDNALKVASESPAKSILSDDVSGPEIPQAFTDAALASGWTKEQIEEFAAEDENGKPVYTDAELLEMIPHLQSSSSEDNLSDEKPPEDGSVSDTKQESDSKSGDKFQELESKIAALEKIVSESSKVDLVQKEINIRKLADKAFDETAEEFAVFGKTDSLPAFPDGRLIPTTPAYKARQAVWARAVRDHQKIGMPFEDAMKDALQWFKGGIALETAEAKVISELRRKSKNLSAKRTETNVAKTFGSKSEREQHYVEELARKAGVNV